MAPNTAPTKKTATKQAPAAEPAAASRKPQEWTAVVRETKAERQARAVAEWRQVRAGEASIGGGLLAGLPSLPEGDVWLDGTWVSVILGGTAEATINYWVSQGKPARNPFPRPHQYLRISLWKLSEVLAWAQAEGILADLPAGLAR